jgi:hypothetical protein
MNRLPYPYLACALLSACSIQKDLLTAGQLDTDSSTAEPALTTGSVTTEDPPTDDPSTTADPPTTDNLPTTGPGPELTTGAPDDEDTGEPLPRGCMLLPGEGDSYISPQAGPRIEEACTVTAVDPVVDGVEIVLDCPLHAIDNAGLQPRFTILTGGPTPTLTVGEALFVFYVQEYDGGDFSAPERELLFLRRDDHLVYATMHGRAYEDPQELPELFAPLLMTTPMGPCPFTASDEFADSTGGPLDGWECYFGAVAELHLGFADDPPLVLTEGNDGALQAGDRSYAVDLRRAQISEGCVDNPERRIVTLAVALQ